MKKRFNIICLVASVLPMSCTPENTSGLDSAIIAESVEFTWELENEVKLYYDESGTQVYPMVKGENTRFTISVSPEPDDLTFPDFQWTSSNPEVASVEQDGTVSAVSGGEAIITVQPTTVNVPATTSIKVVVHDQLVNATSVSVSDNHDLIHAETGYPMCSIGETLQLTAVVSPEDATYKTVLWSSSNEAIASIDPVSGLVTGVSVGPVTITANTIDGSNIRKTHNIYIAQVVNPVAIKVDNIPADNTVISLTNGYYSFDYEIYPADATRSRVKWTSSDESVATVDGRGMVTFIKYGKVTISATCPESDETAPEGFIKGFSSTFVVPAGYYHDHFLATDYDMHWAINSDHAKNGAKQELLTDPGTGERYYKFTPYVKNNQGRGDIMRGLTYISLDYPIICFRIDDVNDRTRDLNGVQTAYPRQINFDTSGFLDDGTAFSGNVGGSNNKWIRKYKCSDGSALLIYDLSQQQFPIGGYLPEGKVATFTTFQIKYADINKGNVFPDLTPAEIAYRFFWFHTFTSMTEMEDYLKAWSGETGITYTEYTE